MPEILGLIRVEPNLSTFSKNQQWTVMIDFQFREIGSHAQFDIQWYFKNISWVGLCAPGENYMQTFWEKKTISTPNEQNVAETTILSFERKRLLVNISMQINAYCSYHVGWDVYFFSPLDKGPWNNKKKYICKACGAARNLGQSEHIESIGQSNNKKSAHIFFSLAFSLVHCLYV